MEAFTNELTREFLQPTKKVMEGYYLFQSKRRKYTMAFLEEATFIERSYRLKKESKFEDLHISIHNERDFGMDVFFYSYHNSNSMENI